MTKIFGLLAALLAMQALVAAGPAMSDATVSPIFQKTIWGPVTLPDGTSAFPTYHQLGVQVFQIQIPWYRIAPEKPIDAANPNDPKYYWWRASNLDYAIQEAAKYNIEVAVMVTRSPPWANGGQPTRTAPINPQDYADFMTAMAKRYPTIRKWMIWGEVTAAGNFAPMPPDSPVGPEKYAEILDAAYGALKAVNPDNVVIGGMTTTGGLVSAPDFIKWLYLPNGQRPRLDMWGHNPYSHRALDLKQQPIGNDRDFADIDTLANELKAAYPDIRTPGTTWHGPPLWLSEFTASSDAPNRVFKYFVSRAEQARRLSQAYWIAATTPYTAGLGWFNLLDEPLSQPGALTTGLETFDEVKKPAFPAYAAAPEPPNVTPPPPPPPPPPPIPPFVPSDSGTIAAPEVDASSSAPLGRAKLRLRLKVRRQSSAQVLKRGLRVKLSCSERCKTYNDVLLRRHAKRGAKKRPRAQRIGRRTLWVNVRWKEAKIRIKKPVLRRLIARKRSVMLKVRARTRDGRVVVIAGKVSWRHGKAVLVRIRT